MATQQMIRAFASSSRVSFKKYDVFLSFRGEDTRTNFTGHLYDALIQKKVEAFIDNRIEKGDEISPALIQAIEDSHVSIVIFSKDYASSKWCLNELIKILQCKEAHGQIVIPVFYNIQPTHVRNQTGSYEKAFAKYERDLKHNKDKLHKWKTSLTQATYIVGYEFPSHKYGNESDLIKDIVKDVLRKLKHRYPFEVEGLVGIEKKCEDIESLLKIGLNNVRVVGLWGMGGVGKTTLATALCGKLCPQFEGYCFLENVREELKRQGVNVVRQRLLSALLEEPNLRLDAPYVENPSIKRKLVKKKVFLVLDDVATSKQIEALFFNSNINNCLGSDSRVIVTTRDKRVCSQFDECEIYEVKELNKHASLELFCLSAFKEKHPKIGYEELSESVIEYCKGNPLALKVLGARLCSRSKEAWKSDLKKLQKIPDMNIHNVLKLSYDDLEYTEKNIFLDIACFFNGKSIADVIHLLEACDFFPFVGIQVLIDKALITISYYGKIGMHDLIEEMGQEIVHQECIKDPGKRSRLWKVEEVAHVLKNNKGTEKVEGISFNCSEVGNLSLSSNSFKKMTNLRYLHIYHSSFIDNVDFLDNLEKLGNVYFHEDLEWLSDNLRCLRWDAFPFKSLPLTFCAEMLIEIKMPFSKLKKLWDGVQNLSKLHTITLYNSKELIEMPDLSRALNLETIDLDGCQNLLELCPSILSLPKLADLHLHGCKKIESVRSNIHSKSLRVLYLDDCSSLTEFSVTSEEMEWLSLKGTAIRELPSSFWRNNKLRYLDLSDCKQLSIVGKKLLSDDDPERLGFLEELKLSGCTQIDALNLGILLDGMTSLVRLYLNGCSNLEALPNNIRKHSMLKHLELDDCTKLVFSLTDLPTSLIHLRAAICIYLDTRSTQLLSDDNPGAGLGFLKELNLSGCTQIDELNLGILLDGIPSLLGLDLTGCSNLEALPDNIQKHSMLQFLILDDCRKLVSVTELLLPSLLYLTAVNCTYLDTDSTQRIFLENKLQSMSNRSFYEDEDEDEDEDEEEYKIVYDGAADFLLVPGGQVPDKFDFHTTEAASITIPPIPKSGLRGFIFCIILSGGLIFNGRFNFLDCYGNDDFTDTFMMYYEGTLVSDHVFLFWCDYNEWETEGGHYNPSFEFKVNRKWRRKENELSTDGIIKGCGVLPVYYTSERGLELDAAGTAQASEVEGSTNENEEEEEEEDQDLIVKSSCDCSIGLFFKHCLGIFSKQ